MKHFNLYIAIFLGLIYFGSIYAQTPKMDEARINFISQKLQLSASENKSFWPLYNEFIDKMKFVRKEKKKLFAGYNYSPNTIEAEQFISKYSQLENLEYQIKSEYIQKFKQIIGPLKTAYLLKAEEEFRLELIKILKTDKSD